MLVACMMTADNPGVPQHIKKLEPDLEPIFLAGKQIDESTGERLAAWAAGHEAPDDTARHVKSLESADNMDTLKAAFEVAYKSSKDDEKRGRFKRAYDERKSKLGEATTI
jgi:hypothetical protein